MAIATIEIDVPASSYSAGLSERLDFSMFGLRGVGTRSYVVLFDIPGNW